MSIQAHEQHDYAMKKNYFEDMKTSCKYKDQLQISTPHTFIMTPEREEGELDSESIILN